MQNIILNWRTYLIRYVTYNLLVDLLSDKKPLMYGTGSFNGSKVFNIYTSVNSGGAYSKHANVCPMISFGRAKAKILMNSVDILNTFDEQPKDESGFINIDTEYGLMKLDKYQAAAIAWLADKIKLFISDPDSAELAGIKTL